MAKKKQFPLSRTQNLLEQCRQMPGQVRSVCEQAVRSRYARHYHPSNPYRRRHVVVDMIMAIGLVFSLAAVAFITLVYQRSVQHQQIEVSFISERSAVSSGDLVSVRVEVRNNGRQDLEQAQLQFPESTGFIMSQTAYELGTVKGRDTAFIDVSGTVIGEVGSAVRLNSVLSYNTALGTQQEVIASDALAIAGSQMVVDLEIPESLAVGKVFPFTFIVQNQSTTAAFDTVLITPNLPPSWETVETSLAVDPATSAWTIDRLGSLDRVTITGRARVLTATASTVSVGMKAYAAPFGTPYLQAETTRDVPVFAPKVLARIVSVPPFVRLGEESMITIDITNTDSVEATDMRIHANISELLIDAERVDGLWVIPVESVPAQTTKRVTIPLRVRPTINPELAFGTGEVALPWVAELHYMHDGQLITVPFDRVMIPFVSDLSLVASGRYTSSEGEAIGTGPWPARVGETTTLWVFLQPSNRFNVLNRVALSAQLGEGVRFTGRQSVTAGQAIVVDSAGRVRWDIGTMDDYTAIGAEPVYAALELAITPTSEAQITNQTLLESLSVSAIDAVVQTTVSAIADDVDLSMVVNGLVQ